MTRHEVEARFLDEYTAWEADPFTFAPEAGESGLGVLARALPVVREIVVAHTGQNVLVVSHKATLRLLLSSLLGFDARGYRDRPGSVARLPQRRRLQGPGPGASDAVQRRLPYQDQPRRAAGNLSKWWDPPGR